jgi:hypothetical protein
VQKFVLWKKTDVWLNVWRRLYVQMSKSENVETRNVEIRNVEVRNVKVPKCRRPKMLKLELSTSTCRYHSW